MKLLTSLTLLTGAALSQGKNIRGADQEHKQIQAERQLQDDLPPVLAIDDYYRVQEGERLDVDGRTQQTLSFLNNDFVPSVPDAELIMDRWFTEGFFQGTISRIDDDRDGTFRYEPADGFVGTEYFRYVACWSDNPTICDDALVRIEVYRDPSQPDRDPVAFNDYYTLYEGETLRIPSPGFLVNDRTGTPWNRLVVCDTDQRDIQNFLDIDRSDDGSFDYEVQRCRTGVDTFTYQACYEDYPDMVSNIATVQIRVDQDPNRPRPPDAREDRYQVYEAETLSVPAARGVLSNDGPGSLYIDRWEELSVVGDLNVEDDGSFTYTAISGQLGFQEFSYTVCQAGWEECVDCRDAIARIEVTPNPRKPATPPQPTTKDVSVLEGEVYRDNAKGSVEYDTRYTLAFEEFEQRGGFSGVLNTDEDGSFSYGNAPVGGTDVFAYKVCYQEWPDLCSIGQINISTKTTGTGSGTQRRGVATYYQVNWGGKDQSGGCATIQPKLTLTCKGVGEISKIETGLPSDNDLCTTDNETRTITCSPKQQGTVYAECRDGSGRNNINREITATLYSDPVNCGGSTFVAPPFHTYHVSSVKMWCNETWVDKGNTCSATSFFNQQYGNLCYADLSTGLPTAQPPTITMSPVDYEQCFVTGSVDFVPAPETPVLERVGNDDSPLSAFPLKQCQGDCDDDSDCEGDLICYQRSGTEVVPGCAGSGTGESFDGVDFCIRSFTSDTPSSISRTEPDNVLQVVGDADGDDHPLYPLLECEADCDDDDECMGDLICFHRSGNEAVPGCSGDQADFEGRDFCVRPNAVAVPVVSTRSSSP